VADPEPSCNGLEVKILVYPYSHKSMKKEILRWQTKQGPRKSYRVTDGNYNKKLIANPFVAEFDEGQNHETWKRMTGDSIGYPGWTLLYNIALTCMNPDRFNIFIETGTNWAFSAIMIGQAIKDCPFAEGRCHTIEINETTHKIAERHIKRAGLEDYVTCELGNSLEVLSKLLDGPVSFAFLDGKHTCEHVLAEFKLIFPFLKPESIVMFDNTHKTDHKPFVCHALKQIKKEYGGNLINFNFVSWGLPGIAAWQR